MIDSADATWAIRVRRFRTGFLGALAAAVPAASALDPEPWRLTVLLPLLACSVVIAWAAIRQGRRRSASALGLLALGLGLFGVRLDLIVEPGWVLVMGALFISIGFWRKRPLRRGGLDAVPPELLSGWGALGPAGFVAVVVGVSDSSPPARVAALASAGFASAIAAQAVVRYLGRAELVPTRQVRQPRAAALFIWLGSFVLAAFAGLEAAPIVLVAGAFLVLCVPPLAGHGNTPFDELLQPALGRPELLLALSFGGTIVFAALVFSLPGASDGAKLPVLDALFTAVSAVCVTGLSVIDAGAQLSFTGEVALLVAIQIGGLGIMTFSTAALAVLRQRPSVAHERALDDVFVSWEGVEYSRAVRSILVITAIVEFGGGFLLAARLAGAYHMPIPDALWEGLFTAVSAFCNAGFALRSDSLVQFQHDGLYTGIISVIIFTGALGPFAVVSAYSPSGRSRVGFRLMVAVTVALSVLGFVLFAALEWGGALAGMGFLDRLHNAWFQSITLRTAGFNSVDFGHLAPATQVMMMAMMFIGGAPGSTAGGVKTTTLAVILLSVVAAVRGRPEVVHRSRRIDHESFYRAVAIVVLGSLAVLGLWTALLMTQSGAAIDLLFESVSALGTVGLTVGVTSELDEVGKVLIAVAMFVGRLGPATVLFLFASDRAPVRVRYPKVGVPVG